MLARLLKEIKKKIQGPIDYNGKSLPADFLDLYELCKPYTMTSRERMLALYDAVHYVLDNDLKGDFVECGVWKGGSSLLMGLILQKRNITNRKIFMYDTYEGMSEPTAVDISLDGVPASQQLRDASISKSNSVWCYSNLEEVKSNFVKAGVNLDLFEFVVGKVEDTIPQTMPANLISILRLDTDWYESTRHEMDHLYSLLVEKGVLIIDDYGHWDGAKKAIDEYFVNQNIIPLLSRVDYSGRMMIKHS